MEKPFLQLSAKSKIRLKVSPKILREAADRLENELRVNTLSNQEAELDFSPSLTLFAEPEPTPRTYPSISSDDTVRGAKPVETQHSEVGAPVLN